MRTVLTAVEQELRGSGSDVGYRSVWQRLVTDHGLVVCKETVRHALRIIDPDGVDRRLRHRLQRRQYKILDIRYWILDRRQYKILDTDRPYIKLFSAPNESSELFRRKR